VSFQFSQQGAKSSNHYAGVEEQSGIWAGAGGFDIHVNRHTDLKGAVIVSADEATQNNCNRLVTQTLTRQPG